jgi:hypothetical protein
MNLKRAAMLCVLGGALAAWLAAAATSGRPESTVPIVTRPPVIDSRGQELASEIERLHERLRPAAAPREPARNLFSYTAPKPPPPSRQEIEKAALAEVPAAPAPPPPLKLEGLAEDVGPDGSPVRTAVISAQGQLFLVKEGDLIASRFRVVKVSAEVVEIVDPIGNSTLRLALK